MRQSLPLASLLALSACYAPPPAYNVAPSSPVNVAYSCADGQTPVVRYFPDSRATIRLSANRTVELAGREDATGGTFTGEGVVLRTEGSDATLEIDGAQTSCKRTPSA
jgi:hypothetical protein